jgi:hypothetical protein
MLLAHRPRRLRFALLGLFALAALAVVVARATSQTTSGAPAFDAAAARFTLAVVPDTQYLYDDDRGDSEPLNDAFDWIAAHRGADTDNIAFTANLGDVTQDGTADEVARASASYGVLDRARVPYSTLAGNHDINSSTTDQRGGSPYLSAFGPARFRDDPTFGGASPDGYNSYHVFTAAGRQWLVLALDWRLSDKGFAWAQSVLTAHPRTPTILTTHELVSAGSDGVASPSSYGQQIWDKLIRHNDQVFLTLNGHFWPVGRTVRQNDFGHDVALNITNYQDKYYGGAGMIRTYAFDLERNTIDVSTFSPWAQSIPSAQRTASLAQMVEKTDADNRFSIPFDIKKRFADLDPQGEPPALDTNDLNIPGTLALWRPPADGSTVTTLKDASGKGNDLTAQTIAGSSGDAATITRAGDHDPASPTKGSLVFHGGKGPGRGTWLQTAADAPLNRQTFAKGYTFEGFFKLPKGCCDGTGNAWMGLMGQQGTGGDAGRTQNDPDEGVVELAMSGGAELQWAVWPTNRGDNTTTWGHLLDDGAENAWHHFALVNDGRYTDMYIDDALVSRNPLSKATGLASTGKPWLLGAIDYANKVEQTFSGQLGDVRIVDHALTPSQFMDARDALGLTAGRVTLGHHDRPWEGADKAWVTLANVKTAAITATISGTIELPRSGQRLAITTRTFTLAGGASTNVGLVLPAATLKALRAAGPDADGARLQLRMGGSAAGGSTKVESLMLHLDAQL